MKQELKKIYIERERKYEDEIKKGKERRMMTNIFINIKNKEEVYE